MSTPDAPTALIATVGNTKLWIAMVAPTNTGDSAISNYSYSIDGGNTYTLCSPAQTTSPIYISGLTNDTAYSINLKAVNDAGQGTASASISATPIVAQPANKIFKSKLVGSQSGGATAVFTDYIHNNLYTVDIGWYAYNTCAERIGTVTAINTTLVGNSTITIGSIQKAYGDSTGTGFINGGYFFFAKPNITIVAASYNSGANTGDNYGCNTGVFTKGISTNQTTGVFSTTAAANISSVKVGWRCYDCANQDAHIGTVTAIDYATGTITLDYPNFVNVNNNNNTTYYFADTSSEPNAVYPILGGRDAGGSTFFTNAYQFGALWSSTVEPGYLCYSANANTPNLTYVGIVRKGGSGQTTTSQTGFLVLSTGSYVNSSSMYYYFAHPSYTISGYWTPTAVTTTTYTATATFPSSMFTTTEGYTRVAPNWIGYMFYGGQTYYAGTVTTNNYPTSNIININRYYGVSSTGSTFFYSNSINTTSPMIFAALTPPLTVPTAPVLVVATAGDKQVSMAFSITSIGGSALTNIQYSIDNGATYTECSPAQTTSPVLITGLTNGTAYTIKLTLTNGVGTSAASTAVVSTPAVPPDAPTSLVATFGNTQISIAFTPPAYNGGTAITNYAYSTNGGTTYTVKSPAQTTSPLIITGLTNGTTYTILLKAVNVMGQGTASDSVVSIPATVPTKPLALAWTSGDGKLYITFTAPSSNGGSAITNYQYTVSGVSYNIVCSPATTTGPVIISGLTAGTSYYAVIYAMNIAGVSPQSDAIYATPYNPPGLTYINSTTITDSQVSLSINTYDNGGSAVTNYQYSLDGGATYTTFSPATNSSTIVITTVTNGMFYNIKLKAINAAGPGTASANVLAVLPEIILVSPPYYANTSQTSTVMTLTTTEYSARKWSSIQSGWFAYLATTNPGEKVGTVSSNNGTTAITINTVLKNNVNTSGGFGTVAGEYYFFAKSNIAFTASSLNSGATGSNIGTFLTGISTNQTTGATITTANISSVKVGWRCYTGASPQAHIGTVTAIDLGTGTVTLDVATFITNNSYFFGDPTNMRVYGSVAGGAPSSLAGATYGAPTYTSTQKFTSFVPYVSTGYLCYSYTPTKTSASLTYNFTYVGLVLWDGSSLVLTTGSFFTDTSVSYIFVHPDCIISGAAPATAGTGTVTATFDGSMFTTSAGFMSVTAGWNSISRTEVSGIGYVSRLGNVASVLYPTTNRITISAASVPAITYADMLFSTFSAATVPGIPTNLVASTSGSTQLSIAFTAPINNGRSGIINYAYSIDGGTTYIVPTTATSVSPLVISGLTNGTTYTISIKAINVIGTGLASTTTTGIPGIPGIPTSLVATTNGTQASVSFTAPSNGGVSISNYQYSLDGGVTFTARSPAISVSPVLITGLTADTVYTIYLKAVNSVSVGASSVGATTTPAFLPDPPTSLVYTAADSQISLAFTPPAYTGGTPITNYSYSLNGGTTYTVKSPVQIVSPLVFTGLTNGTTYTILLKAINWVGLSVASSSIVGRAARIPYAPTSLVATVGVSGQVSVAFIPPSNNGGSPITNYVLFQYAGGPRIVCSPAQTTSPVIFTGLTNGTGYTLYIKAINESGDGDPAGVSATPIAVPAAPTSLVATSSDSQLSIAFTAGSNNGSTITNYQYSLDGGSTYTAFSPVKTASPVVITGLTNGTSYTVLLKGVNAAGTGTASTSIIAIPGTPGAPTSLSATAGNTQLSLTFTAPTSTGGFAISNYAYSTDAGITYTAASPAQITSPLIIPNLANGTAYTILLKAVNINGMGNASTSVVKTPIGSPGAPTALIATGGDTQISVAFTIPATNGGYAITNYSYSTNGGTTYTVKSPAQTTSPILITGLTNGIDYTILLKAINSSGAGLASASIIAAPVSTLKAPGAPTSLIATAGNSLVSVAFAAPADDGGSAITNYSYSTDGGSTYTVASPSQTTSPILITGLTNEVSYTIQIKAINAIGTGTASASVVSTPIGTPSAPILISATIGDSSLSIAFTEPSSTGGSAITNYVYSIDNGSTYTAFAPAQTTSPLIISNLTNGTSYSIKLKAVNVMGYGTASGSITQTPAGIPGAPSALVATIIDNTTVQISFTPGAENGADVTNYFYSINGGVSYAAFSPAQNVAPLTISGLTLGETYSITIKEIDAGGVSPAATAIPVVFTAPDAPSALHATTETGKTTVAFVSPSPGGALISNYEYSLDNGATFTAFSPAQTSSPVTITGLSDTATYYIQFKAVNIIGKSPASPTVSIIPATPPVETVSFSANESSVIVLPTTVEVEGVVVDVVKYWYSIDFGVTWIDPSNIVSIANLTNGVSYTIWYYAETAVGFGPTYVTSVIPAPSTPSAPTITTITPNTAGTELSIYFTAPVSNGGFAITDYQYTIDNGTTILTAGQTTSPIIVSGTIRNQVYPTAIAAVNSIGVGESSTIVVIKTFLPCFGKGTWIQCEGGYKRIEHLVAGDMVCTLKHGLIPIHTIGSRTIINSQAPGRTPDHMYICSADAYPEVFEDLVLTGYHALLVPAINNELKEKVKVLYNGMLYMTDGMVRVPVCADDRAVLHPDIGEKFTIYNFALESNDIYMNYGVYANGLLVETSSIRFMTDLADMA